MKQNTQNNGWVLSWDEGAESGTWDIWIESPCRKFSASIAAAEDTGVATNFDSDDIPEKRIPLSVINAASRLDERLHA